MIKKELYGKSAGVRTKFQQNFSLCGYVPLSLSISIVEIELLPLRSVSTEAALEPTVPVPVFTQELQDREVKEGLNVTLDAKLPADCKAEVKWFKDGKPLSEDHHLTIIAAGDLHCVNIFNATVEDEAVYKIVATNATGSAESDCELLIEGWCGFSVLYCALKRNSEYLQFGNTDDMHSCLSTIIRSFFMYFCVSTHLNQMDITISNISELL